MSSIAPTQVVRITGDMDAEHRRAALRALASGATVVEMPASFELLHGEAVHSDDQAATTRGTVTFQGRAYQVSAQRLPRDRRYDGYYGSDGPRRFPLTFTGDVDTADRVVRGTVDYDVSPYNRRMLRLAVLGGLLIGGGLAVGLGHLWTALLLVPGIAALMARIAIVTGTRRARVMVDDLQRIAVLAAGHRPRTTEARPPRKR